MQVVVLDKLDYCASTNNLSSLADKPNFRVSRRVGGVHLAARLNPCAFALQFIKGDIQSMDLISYILKTEEIDTVMHFAAQVRMGGT
jgi:UDP-glucose 4,6-dehydratase